MTSTSTQTIENVGRPALHAYEQVPESKYNRTSSISYFSYICYELNLAVDWADLITLDLSRFDIPGEKQKLANQLRDAVHKVGFFYITGFGLSQDEINRQFAIGREIFALSEEEKLKYRADLEHGNYNGYRPLGSIELFPGRRDNVEMYNVFKFIPACERSQPEVICTHREEIERFQRHIASDVVQKLLTLISIVMELPEDYFSRGHRYDDVSDCHLRYMIYRARTPAENAQYDNLYSRGHTDFGSLTLLFRQPIAALQVRMPDGAWRWVKPHASSITVNIADVLQFWTSGYLKSSIHRVVAPPEDQAHLDRLGLLYFLRPAHDLDLKTVDSPLLRRLGLKQNDEATGIKAGDWVQMRVRQNLDRAQEGGTKEKEVLGGVKVKYYD